MICCVYAFYCMLINTLNERERGLLNGGFLKIVYIRHHQNIFHHQLCFVLFWSKMDKFIFVHTTRTRPYSYYKNPEEPTEDEKNMNLLLRVSAYYVHQKNSLKDELEQIHGEIIKAHVLSVLPKDSGHFIDCCRAMKNHGSGKCKRGNDCECLCESRLWDPKTYIRKLLAVFAMPVILLIFGDKLSDDDDDDDDDNDDDDNKDKDKDNNKKKKKKNDDVINKKSTLDDVE